MPRGHNSAVVLVVKSGTAKVHHTYCRALNRPLFPLLQEKNVSQNCWTLMEYSTTYYANSVKTIFQTAAVGILYLFMKPQSKVYWQHLKKRSTMVSSESGTGFSILGITCHLTFSTLKDIVKSELTNRMFSGFKSVCVSLLSWRSMENTRVHLLFSLHFWSEAN